MKNSLRTCYSCNRLIPFNEECKACNKEKKQNRQEWEREYRKDYDEKHKESIAPIKTKRWQQLRELIISRDGGYCQRCLSKDNYINNNNLEVHHIKPRISHPELIFDETNLITVCQQCNSDLGTSGELDFEIITPLDAEIEFNL